MTTQRSAFSDHRQSGKISMAILIVIVACVLILGLSSVAAAYFMSRAPEAEHAADAAAHAEQEKAPDPVFVTVKPLTINLRDDAGHMLYVGMSLKVAGEEGAKQIEAFMPEIRNRILMTVTDERPQNLTTSEGKRALAERLRDRIAAPLSEQGEPLPVDDVLFTDFIVQ